VNVLAAAHLADVASDSVPPAASHVAYAAACAGYTAAVRTALNTANAGYAADAAFQARYTIDKNFDERHWQLALILELSWFV